MRYRFVRIRTYTTIIWLSTTKPNTSSTTIPYIIVANTWTMCQYLKTKVFLLFNYTLQVKRSNLSTFFPNVFNMNERHYAVNKRHYKDGFKHC